jgi:hypothetical protein
MGHPTGLSGDGLPSLGRVLQDFEFGWREDSVVLDIGFVETSQHITDTAGVDTRLKKNRPILTESGM